MLIFILCSFIICELMFIHTTWNVEIFGCFLGGGVIIYSCDGIHKCMQKCSCELVQSLKGWVFMTILCFDIKVALHMLTGWWMVFRGWWLHVDRKLKVLMYPVYISTNWKIAGISPPHTKTKCRRGKWEGCQSSVTVPRLFGKSLYCSFTSAIIHYNVVYLYFY